MKHWKVTIKEAGKSSLLTSSYIGNVDEEFLIDFYGLRNSDVEWFKITEMIKCSICGVEIPLRDSHNAVPVNDGRCCSECNYSVVIPKRLKL